MQIQESWCERETRRIYYLFYQRTSVLQADEEEISFEFESSQNSKVKLIGSERRLKVKKGEEVHIKSRRRNWCYT